ncbi:MAG TPA: hypothetical protein VGE08_20880 [Steroidobacter sp.]
MADKQPDGVPRMLVMSPPLVIEPAQIDEIGATLRAVLTNLA